MTEAIHTAMTQAVRKGIFPDADLLVAKGGTICHHAAYGSARKGTIFDVASLTKALVTTTLIMQAIQKRELSLEDSITSHLPNQASSHQPITIVNLLTHSSGLPAWQPYYREIPNRLIGTEEAKKIILESISFEPLIYKTGSKSLYSDPGFVLLGALLEQLYKSPLQRLFEERIANKANMLHSFFVPMAVKPLTPIPDRRFAPTEDCPWRQKVIHGDVHDQNCYAMGGVAGHAGLFSTTEDIHRLLVRLVDSYKGQSDFIAPDIVRLFWSDQFTPPDSTWRLGWDSPSRPVSSTGRYTSDNCVGHLGYTGCLITIDLDQDYWIILLTNRIHPTTTNEQIKQFRPYIHDLIWEELVR